MPRRQSIGKRQCKRALGQASSSPQRPITNFLQPLAELGEDIEDDDAGFILPRTQRFDFFWFCSLDTTLTFIVVEQKEKEQSQSLRTRKKKK